MILNWHAGDYSQNSEVQKLLSFELIDKEQLENKSIMDIGCGDGAITSYLQKKSKKKVLGVDLSIDMLNFAKKNYPECRFIMQDVSTLSIEEKFNVITSFNCLHWVSDLKKALELIYKSLDKSGRFLGLIYPRCEHLWKASENIAVYEKYKQYFSSFTNPYFFYSASNLELFLSEVGFENIKIKVETRTHHFHNDNLFLRYISCWMPHMQVAPPEFVTDWIYEFRRLTNQHEESINMVYDVITFNCVAQD